ncbi:MAG: (d)CMP kinase [Candidatus Sericytochromatia bacterium]|uniref:Cytidylate kinase n=1 Tax=Candidatus Tanganyikabacteria bacterium TaxID=2961651 RepID=A0A937X5C0_9BACT|nr:(d)CMP kinase [Candidatus Tanganyikabacteria bacterium]
MTRVITLDGPAGAGKSTVAKALASRLGYRYLDTGAMYRAITWKALEQAISLEDDAGLTAVAEGSRLELQADPAEMRVVIDGYDVTSAIREPRISQAVSYVARIPGVRRVMVDLQRQIGRGGSLVAEGRDMAMVVFPDAALKIYLNASPRERARRRAADLAEAGHPADVSALEQEIARRDHLDSTRADSPLTHSEAHTAVVTDDLTVDQVVDRIIDLL